MERAEFSVGTGHWLGRGTSSIDQAVKLGRQLKKRGGAGGDFVLFFGLFILTPKITFALITYVENMIIPAFSFFSLLISHSYFCQQEKTGYQEISRSQSYH